MRLPNKSIVSISSALGAPVTVSAVSNAAEAVVTAAAHGFIDGDYVLMESGWSKLNGRVLRVKSADTGTFVLEGFNSTDTDVFQPGAGAGTAKKVNTWAQLSEVLNLTTEGGDPQFWNYQPLESDSQKRIATGTTPLGINFELGDNPTNAGQQAIVAASDAGSTQAIRILFPDGRLMLFGATVSTNNVPTLAVNTGMVIRVALSIESAVTRYES